MTNTVQHLVWEMFLTPPEGWEGASEPRTKREQQWRKRRPSRWRGWGSRGLGRDGRREVDDVFIQPVCTKVETPACPVRKGVWRGSIMPPWPGKAWRGQWVRTYCFLGRFLGRCLWEEAKCPRVEVNWALPGTTGDVDRLEKGPTVPENIPDDVTGA